MTEINPAVSEYMRTIGQRGAAGRLAGLSPKERLAFSQAGVKASKKARRDAAKQRRIAGTHNASQGEHGNANSPESKAESHS